MLANTRMNLLSYVQSGPGQCALHASMHLLARLLDSHSAKDNNRNSKLNECERQMNCRLSEALDFSMHKCILESRQKSINVCWLGYVVITGTLYRAILSAAGYFMLDSRKRKTSNRQRAFDEFNFPNILYVLARHVFAEPSMQCNLVNSIYSFSMHISCHYYGICMNIL